MVKNEVTFDNQEQRVYKEVLVCNGHHWCKRFPELSLKIDEPENTDIQLYEVTS